MGYLFDRHDLMLCDDFRVRNGGKQSCVWLLDVGWCVIGRQGLACGVDGVVWVPMSQNRFERILG